MVKIENITRIEEERKSKIKRTKDLLNKFFDNMCITNTSAVISVSENMQSNPFLFVYFYSKPEKVGLSAPKYYEKALAFAREYEEKFNLKDVVLQTDYSK